MFNSINYFTNKSVLKTFLLLLITVTLSSCEMYKEVKFKGVKDFSVKEFSTKEITVEVQAVIDNPNGFNITIYDSDLDFIVNGTKLGKAKMDRNIVLKKKTEDTYTFVVKAEVKDFSSKMGLLLPILMRGKAKVKIKGYVFAKAMMVKKKVPVDFVKEIAF